MTSKATNVADLNATEVVQRYKALSNSGMLEFECKSYRLKEATARLAITPEPS